MPPQQCPECGRFLKNAFVASLGEEPTACPRCEAALVASMFAANAEVTGPSAPSGESARAGSAAGDEEPSVRPPDLRPDAVRDHALEVLEGWDRGVGPLPVRDRAPFPLDAVVVAGAGLAGAVLGAVFDERRPRGAAMGAAGGVLGAAVARRLWRLE